MYTIADINKFGRALRYAIPGYRDVVKDAHKRVINKNVIVWQEYKANDDFLFMNLQAMYKLLQQIRKIQQDALPESHANYNYLMVFPLLIKNIWVVGVISINNGMKLQILDPLNVLSSVERKHDIVSTFVREFNARVVKDEQDALQIEVLAGHNNLAPQYSGPIVLDILNRFFSAGQYSFDPGYYNTSIAEALIVAHRCVQNDYEGKAEHVSSTRQIISARFPHINMEYAYPPDYLWGCLVASLLLQRANPKLPQIIIDTKGMLRLLNGEYYLLDGKNIAICSPLLLDAKDPELWQPLNEILQRADGSSVRILIPVSVNPQHWSVILLDVGMNLQITVHDTMYDANEVADYLKHFCLALKPLLSQHGLNIADFNRSILPAGRQPDQYSAGVLTVPTIERMVFGKSLSAVFTLEYVVALRASHDRLLKQPSRFEQKATPKITRTSANSYQKVQITTIPGYMFFGDVKENETKALEMVNGIEVVSFPADYPDIFMRGCKLSTYSGGFHANKKAWDGNELNQVPELSMCTVFQGARDINGKMHRGFIKCILGDKIPGMHDTYLVYEGLIDNGVPHGFGSLTTHTIKFDGNKKHIVSTACIQGTFVNGKLPAIKASMPANVVKHYETHKGNLQLHVDANLRSYMDVLRQQATQVLNTKPRHDGRALTFFERPYDPFVKTTEDSENTVENSPKPAPIPVYE